MLNRLCALLHGTPLTMFHCSLVSIACRRYAMMRAMARMEDDSRDSKSPRNIFFYFYRIRARVVLEPETVLPLVAAGALLAQTSPSTIHEFGDAIRLTAAHKAYHLRFSMTECRMPSQHSIDGPLDVQAARRYINMNMTSRWCLFTRVFTQNKTIRFRLSERVYRMKSYLLVSSFV